MGTYGGGNPEVYLEIMRMTAQDNKPRQQKPLTAWDREVIASAEEKRYARQERNKSKFYHHGKNNKRMKTENIDG